MSASPEPGGPRSERDRIGAALVELAGEQGYRSMSLDQLLRRAGVGHVAFARHFDSLEDCFTAVWGEVDAELGGRMATAFESGEEWQERLRSALLAGLGYLAEEPGRARLYVDEALFVSEDLSERQRTALTRLSAMIDLGRVGQDGDQAPHHIAEAISGAILHRVRQLLHAGLDRDLPREVPGLMYFAVLPYRGTAAAEAELHRS